MSITPEVAPHESPTGQEPAAASEGVARNSIWMFGAHAFATVVSSLVAVGAVRTLAPASWGQLETALALVIVFSVLAELGMASLTLREMTADPSAQAVLLRTALTALLITSATCGALLFLLVHVLGYSHHLVVLVAVAAPLILLQPVVALFQAAFNSRMALRYAALFRIGGTVAYGATAVLVLLAGWGTIGLAVAMIVGAATSCLVAVGLVASVLRVDVVRGDRRPIPRFLWAAAPISALALVAILYDRIDVFLLSLLGNASEVAEYAVPFKLVRLSWLVPSVISAAAFPVLMRSWRERPEEARELLCLVAKIYLFIAVPFACVLSIGSTDLLPFVFGARYEPAAPVLAVLSWSAVLVFQTYVLWYGILAAHEERKALLVQGAVLVANVVLNVFLIPPYGAVGAAIALLISDALVVLGWSAIVFRYLFRIPVGGILGKPVAAAVAVIPASLLVATRSRPAGAALAGTGYASALLLMRYVPLASPRAVLAWLRSESRGRGTSRPLAERQPEEI